MWHIVEELIALNVQPQPANPFEVDMTEILEIPQFERMVMAVRTNPLKRRFKQCHACCGGRSLSQGTVSCLEYRRPAGGSVWLLEGATTAGPCTAQARCAHRDLYCLQ